MPHRFLSALLLFAAATAAIAQNTPSAPPPACDAPEHRQFDFWLGEWEVWGGPEQDRVVGRNTIARVATGCALREHWVNAGGRDGHSLNVYDRDAKRWAQFWIGSDGGILRLEGGLQGEAMVMTGALPKAGGGTQRQRITWTPQSNGRAEQRWETSDDDGNTWQTAFVGMYRKASSPP
jgi:hypothetical protein